MSGVSSLPAAIAAAAALFAGTNVDDIVMLALLSAASRATGRPRRWQLWAGQYAGFAVLVGVSLAAGRGLDLIPAGWLWLLALIPLTLGMVTLIAAVRTVRQGERPAPPSPGGLLGMAGLVITNGADNLAAYTPFFAADDAGRIAVTLVVFAAGVALWCAVGWWLSGHKAITAVIERYGHWILPAVFILIGLYTLHVTIPRA
jgi:cadmium resistance protein CadD (predicted permease)